MLNKQLISVIMLCKHRDISWCCIINLQDAELGRYNNILHNSSMMECHISQRLLCFFSLALLTQPIDLRDKARASSATLALPATPLATALPSVSFAAHQHPWFLLLLLRPLQPPPQLNAPTIHSGPKSHT